MKKRWRRRAAALLLSAIMLQQSVSAAQIMHHSGLQLADSLSLTGTYAEHGEALVQEQILTYSPGGDVRPVVAFGNTLYGRSTMDYIEDWLEQEGWTSAAAINAAFFDMSTGIPYGMVVTDGILRSSGNTVTVGMDEKGNLQIGRPNLQVRMVWDKGEVTLNYNKSLSKTNGFGLYSRDYDTRTKNSIEACHLILQPETDALSVSGTVKAVVTEIVEDTGSCVIPEGRFVLSLAKDTAYATAAEQMQAFQPGDLVEIRTSISHRWEDVAYAVGGGDLLVDNGGILTSFDLDSAEKQAARTAIGIKSNGDVVCYTADRGNGSDGLTLLQLAQRMKELGCVTAVNLDGGGSTAAGATLPGDTGFTTLNAPSDGQQRPCANFLFFVRKTTSAGQAVRLHLYPHDTAVLPHGQIELSVKATDANYRAAAVPAGVQLSARGGTISGTTFTAGQAGTAEIQASAGGISGSVTVSIVETPTTMAVCDASMQPVTELIVESGTSIDLTAKAQYLGMELAAQDPSFTWSVEERLGTVTQEGVFTAASGHEKGILTVSCGALSVEIPLEVRPNPFADTKNHWAKTMISDLYYGGILQGAADSQGNMYYRPDVSMTRQEFVTAMMRASGVELSGYAQTELPFADTAQISPWALDAVKAAYALGWFTGSGRGDRLYADPDDTITREAAMTILARSIRAESESDMLEQFADYDQVSNWARAALTAMVEQGVINGIDGSLQPQGKVTRAQVAKMLHAMQ